MMRIDLFGLIIALTWSSWFSHGWINYLTRIESIYKMLDRTALLGSDRICTDLSHCILPPIDYANTYGPDAVCHLILMSPLRQVGGHACD